MIVGSKDHKGSFKIRSRTPDTTGGPMSEAYIQHWFQEEFLRLFHEDPEFHEQVLKCLLTGEDDEGNAEVRKPRRTWFNGIDETQEISCEEARYLHLCVENSTDSDLSSEVADERCDVALRTSVAINEKPRKQDLIREIRVAESLEPLADDWSDSPEDMVESPFPSAAASEGQHKNLERSTGPCVHERGTQTWKANPLYLLGNSDSDSNDSWQQEGSNVAWMDDLENGKMLHEIKMRKVKKLEQSQPFRKAEGSHSSIEHSKSDREKYFSSDIRGLPQFFTQDRMETQLQGKKSMHDDIRGHLTIRIPRRATISVVCARPEKNDEKLVKSSPEKRTGEVLGLEEDNSTNLPFVSDCRDTATSPVCLHGDGTGDLTSAGASADDRSSDQDPVLKPPLDFVSQDLPVVFLDDDEKAVLKESPRRITPLKSSLGCEAGFSSGRIPNAQDFDISVNEKTKTLSEFLSPTEAAAETRLKLGQELIAPIPSDSSSAVLDKMNGNEDDAQSTAMTCPTQQESAEIQFVFSTGKISLPPRSHSAHDNHQGEIKSPLESIWGSENSLKEELSISQGGNEGSEDEPVEAELLSPDERNESVQQEIGPFGIDAQTSSDEQGLSLGTPPQASPCGSINRKETTKSVHLCGEMFGEKKAKKPSSPLSVRAFRASRLEAIEEEEQVAHPPEPLSESFFRPIAVRAPFKPAKDIHWLPPKRNIHFMGIQTESPHYPFENVSKRHIHFMGMQTRGPHYPLENVHKRNIHFMGIHTKSARYPLENFNKTNINWDVPCNRPQAQAHRPAHEETLQKDDKFRKGSSRSQQNRIQLWASLLRKVFKKTIMIRWVVNHKSSDQDIGS